MKKVLLTVGENGDAGYISDLLLELGASSVSVSNANTNVPDEESMENWRESTVQAWFMPDVNVENVAMILAADFDLPGAQLDYYDPEMDDSWVDEWRKYIRAIDIGSSTRVYYCESERRKEGVINVLLEVGASFGSGHHVSTQLCVRWLERNLTTSTTLLDYGCGNGILAIRAALHAPNICAEGIDIDERAVEEARRNAAKNGVDHMTAFNTNPPEGNGDNDYDIVVANILAVTRGCGAGLQGARRRP